MERAIDVVFLVFYMESFETMEDCACFISLHSFVFTCYFVCVCIDMQIYTEIRRWLVGVGSLLPPFGSPPESKHLSLPDVASFTVLFQLSKFPLQLIKLTWRNIFKISPSSLGQGLI